VVEAEEVFGVVLGVVEADCDCGGVCWPGDGKLDAGLLVLSSSAGRGRAAAKDAVRTAWGRHRADGHEGISVHVGHLAGLLCPVSGRVLQDAEGVDPQIANPELSGDVDGILKVGRQAGAWDSC
jgi:hypothetical protein